MCMWSGVWSGWWSGGWFGSTLGELRVIQVRSEVLIPFSEEFVE